MKMNIEIECTPEEARRAVGLPDLTPIHDRYVAMMIEAMPGLGDGAMQPEMIETMMRGWQPMGEAGMAFWKRMFDGATQTSKTGTMGKTGG
ncbi:DUF6489 family protein [Sphingomonas aerolata]|uniref:DUF6489 family protein n=1 Tax=Sphingomonas aerolata TaxID=185951 RepID=UPI002FE3CFD0